MASRYSFTECTEIHGSQFGYMPDRNTTDAIFILKQTIAQHMKARKTLESLSLTSRKLTYDRVPRAEM